MTPSGRECANNFVVCSLGRRAPLRRVVGATLAGGARSPATDALLGIAWEIGADQLADNQPPLTPVA